MHHVNLERSPCGGFVQPDNLTTCFSISLTGSRALSRHADNRSFKSINIGWQVMQNAEMGWQYRMLRVTTTSRQPTTWCENVV